VSSERPPPGAASALAPLVLAVAVALPALYAYAYERLTHRLVWYGSFVARPNAMSGIGWTTDELIFAPARWLEATVRPHS